MGRKKLVDVIGLWLPFAMIAWSLYHLLVTNLYGDFGYYMAVITLCVGIIILSIRMGWINNRR